jgi:kinetochore protein NDC80
MPGGRKGGIGGASSSTMSDPRPLSDKQYMVSSAKSLISFLSAHHYTKSVNMKMLSSPTAQEFYSIVEFLYRQIDVNYALPADKKKYEEAIPLIFKSLGYPFTISRTSLSGVGTPHTWPTLLGALSWLVELITFQEQVEAAEREASQWETVNADRLFFDYTSKAYGKFLAGDDANIGVLDAEMAGHFNVRNEMIANEIHSLEHKLQTAEHDEKRALAAPTRLANLEARRQTLASDVDKFRVLIDELEAHSESIAQREALHRAELEAKETAIVATRDEIQALSARLDKQELRPADVERLQSERLTLERTLMALTKEREQSEKSVADKQRAIAEHLARIDAELADYHSEARRLELIPSNAANARGRNLTVQFSASDATASGEQTLSDEIKNNVLPALRDTLEEMRAQLVDDQRQLLQLSADKERLIEQIQDEKADVDQLQHRAKKCDQAYTTEKDKCAAELRGIESEIEKIQAEIDGAKDAVANGLDAAASSVAVRQAHFKQMLAQCSAEKEELTRIMMSMVQAVSRHKQFVAETLEQTYDAICADVKQQQQQQQQRQEQQEE